MSPISAPAPKSTAAQPQSCPRCQKPIVDPQGLGWCKACGYCRSLEEGPKVAAPAPAAGPTRIGATTSAIGETPSWFWVTAIGVVLITGATFAGGYYLKVSPLERALLTTGQIVVGLAAMFAGQLLALVRIGPEDSNIHFFDAILPFRLYGLVFKRLPAARHTLYLGAWGLTAIITAAIFLGGLDHWLKYMPGANKNKVLPVQKAR